MTFSEQIVYGMFKPSKYKEILELKKGRTVLYVIVLMLVLGIVAFLIPTAALITGFGGFEKLFTQKVAPFSFSDGELTIERPFEMTFDYNNILIDSSVETITDNMLEKDGIYYAAGSKTIRLSYVLGRNIYDYQAVELKYLLPEGLDNQMMCEFIPGIYLFLVLMFLGTCLGFFIKYAIYALILSICIQSVNKRMELGLSYGQVFMLCFYGQSFAMVLTNFNMALGLLPTTLVSIVGIFVSIHIITTATLGMSKTNQV